MHAHHGKLRGKQPAPATAPGQSSCPCMDNGEVFFAGFSELRHVVDAMLESLTCTDEGADMYGYAHALERPTPALKPGACHSCPPPASLLNTRTPKPAVETIPLRPTPGPVVLRRT